jgi:hypothetical protein
MGRLDQQLILGAAGELGLVRLVLGIRRFDQLANAGQRGGAGIEDLRLRQEGEDFVAEVGAQRLGPALVFLELAVEALPAGRGELRCLARGVGDRVGVETIAEEVLLEL